MRYFLWIPILLLAFNVKGRAETLTSSGTPQEIHRQETRLQETHRQETRLQEIHLQELQLVIRNLRAENQRLRDRNDLLSQDIILLRRHIEEIHRARNEAEPPVQERPPPPPGHEVLYVNPNWHYLLVAAGTAQNLVPQQEGRILRDNAEIGRVRVTAAKDRQSVADIDLKSLGDRGQYPRAGDRILFLNAPPAADMETLNDDTP